MAAGGHLATIDDPAEQDWLTEAFADARTRNGAHEIAWIGYHLDGEWQWISGEPVTYTNHDPMFPQGGRHAYVHLPPHSHVGTWNANAYHNNPDNPDQQPMGIIEIVGITEPATLSLLGLGACLPFFRRRRG